jgi:xanthine dehydrogenase accessory factor
LKEIHEIIRAYDNAIKAGKKSALASLVHSDGSSYRRPGARMLVTDAGELTGAISGGCLEGDALRKALLVLSQKQSKLITYDTSDEDDATIGIQLGCAGVIQVLFEPLNSENFHNPIQLLRKAVSFRQKSVLVTLFSLEDNKGEQPGTCFLVEENGTISGSTIYPEVDNRIRKDVRNAMEQKLSLFKNYKCKNGSVTAFIEYLQPPVSLVIVGAGNDALPMMKIANIIGWDITVVDGRSTHAKPGRFVSACQVLVGKPGKILDKIIIDEYSAFVLMTHNYSYDLAMLKTLMTLDIPYIGVLGPKMKLNKMLDEMNAEGPSVNKAKLSTIYGPAGLEIGAETAEEIALSIVSEIKAVFSGKQGMPLRNKRDSIHGGNHIIVENKKLL